MEKSKRANRFPLWLHTGTRLWAKKIRGRTCYFGPDKDKALRRYVNEKDDLEAGRTPQAAADALTVRALVNDFLSNRRAKVDSGELTPGMWGDYYHICGQVVDMFKDRAVIGLRPSDFAPARRRRQAIAAVHAGKVHHDRENGVRVCIQGRAD